MLQKFFLYLKDHEIVLAMTIIAVLWLVIKLKLTLAIFFIAYLIMAGISPLIEYLETKFKFPKILAIGLPYLTIPLIIVVLFLTYLPNVQNQLGEIPNLLTGILSELDKIFHIQTQNDYAYWINKFLSFFDIQKGDIFAIANSAEKIVLSTITFFVVSIYMLIAKNSIRDAISRLFAPDEQPRVKNILSRIEMNIGKWIYGQFILSLIVGTAVWIFLLLLGVPFSFLLGLLAAFCELIPFAGPVIAAIPSILAAGTISTNHMIFVLIGFIVIQLIENHILVPAIMKNRVHLAPLITIAAVLAGAELAGFLGAIIAVPLATIFQTIFSGDEQNSAINKKSPSPELF